MSYRAYIKEHLEDMGFKQVNTTESEIVGHDTYSNGKVVIVVAIHSVLPEEERTKK